MKKLFLISISVLALGFISCKKCQTCTVTTVQQYSGQPEQTSTTSEDYCGKEYDDAPAEGTVNQNISGFEQSVTIDCVDQ